MAYQKTYNALILLLVLILILGCRRTSKEYTVARWEIINPVTNTPYVGIPVRLILLHYKNNGPESEVIWEGETNSEGIAEYTFRAVKNNSFGYAEAVNLSILGTHGLDYSIIKRPPMSSYTVDKDKINDLRYEIVPYAFLKQIIKNDNCEGSGDVLKMHMYLKEIEQGINQKYIRNGCHIFETTGSLDNSPDGYRRVYMGTYVYDYEVVRPSGITHGRDSITLNEGEMGTIEILY